MTLATRLRSALGVVPAGSLVPRDWILDLVEEHGDPEVKADFTVGDVAELLERAPSTVRTWCGSGRLPGAYRLRGREWRIPREALQALRDASREDEGGDPDEPVDLGRWRRRFG